MSRCFVQSPLLHVFQGVRRRAVDATRCTMLQRAMLMLQVRAMPSVLQRIGEMNLVFGSMMRLWEPAEFEHLEMLVAPPRIAELRPIGEQLRDTAQSTIYLRRTACKRVTRGVPTRHQAARTVNT